MGSRASPLPKAEPSDLLGNQMMSSLPFISPRSSASPSASAKHTPVYSKEQWEDKKDLIERLWIVENRPWESKKTPQDSVEHILRLEHNFPVTKRQFLRKTDAWGFVKNVKRKEMEAIDIVEKKREARSGKKTEFQVRGRKVPLQKLERWRKSHQNASAVKSEDDEMADATSSISISVEAVLEDMDISYQTPKGGSSPIFEETSVEPIPPEAYMVLDDVNERFSHPRDEMETEFNFGGLNVLSTTKPSSPAIFLGHVTDEVVATPPSFFDAEFSIIKDERDNSRDYATRRDSQYPDSMALVEMGPPSPLSPFPFQEPPKQKAIQGPTMQISWALGEEKKWMSTLQDMNRQNAPLPDRLPTMSKVAWSLFKQSKFTPAERWFRNVAVSSSKIYGKTHRKTIDAYSDTVKCLVNQGQYLQAEKVYRLLSMRAKETLSSNDELLLRVMFLGAQISTRFSRYDDTENSCREMLQVVLTSFGRGSLLLLSVFESLAAALYHKKLLHESETVLFELLSLQRGSNLEDIEARDEGMRLLAYVLMAQNRAPEAEGILRNILANSRANHGPRHKSSLETLVNLTWCFMRQGKYDEAIKIGERAYKASEEVLGELHSTTLHALHGLATICCRRGNYEASVEYELRRVGGIEQTRGPDHPYTLQSYSDLGWSYYNLFNYTESLNWYQKANAGYRNLGSQDHVNQLASSQAWINWLTNNIQEGMRIEEEIMIDERLPGYPEK